MAHRYKIKYFYDIQNRADFHANPDYKGVCHVALAQEGHTKPGDPCSMFDCDKLACLQGDHLHLTTYRDGLTFSATREGGGGLHVYMVQQMPASGAG